MYFCNVVCICCFTILKQHDQKDELENDNYNVVSPYNVYPNSWFRTCESRIINKIFFILYICCYIIYKVESEKYFN